MSASDEEFALLLKAHERGVRQKLANRQGKIYNMQEAVMVKVRKIFVKRNKARKQKSHGKDNTDCPVSQEG